MSSFTFGAGPAPPVTPTPQWLWSFPASGAPVVSGYPIGGGQFAPTKTGLLPQDLQNYVGVPLQIYGNPPTPVPTPQILQWIRYAEDNVEQESGLLLCQTWVASPPAQALAVSGLTQTMGRDFDLADAGYDFQFPRAQDEGWMMYSLRYRPVRSSIYSVDDYSAVKNYAYIYPLLNDFFRVSPSWFVVDEDYGLIRLVPAQNVQMLPLFAMQLAFMGFAESIPGAIWVQYTAGLTPNDYNSRFSFMKQLVLAEAAMIALRAIQGTINMGLESIDTMVDGLRTQMKYDKRGAFGPLIAQFKEQRDELMKRAKERVNGPTINVL